MTRRRLKLAGWPAADRAAWEQLFAPGGLFDGGGALAHLRSATRAISEHAYSHWLGFLNRQGIDLSEESPSARATDNRVTAWLEEMSDLTETTRHTRLVALHRVLTAMAPEHPQPLLRRLCRRFERLANRQVRRGKLGRVLPTSDLLNAGLAHLDGATGERFRDAIRFRDGLMVATLALLPLRIGNFRDLEIGRSFLPVANGYCVHLAADETKTGRTFEGTVAPGLVHLFDRYLSLYRPLLIARSDAPHNFLWANDWGHRYSHSNLGARITRLTKTMVGTPVHPHLFRDAAATTIARSAPAQARAIRGLLGHATSRTADRHYNPAKTLDAARNYGTLLESMIEEEPRP